MAKPSKHDLRLEAIVINSNNYAEQLAEKQAMYEAVLAGTDTDPDHLMDLRMTLRDLVKCDTNFLSYKDDQNFIKHANSTMNELTDYAALAPLLQDLTQAQYDALRQDVGDLPSLKKLQDKANAYTYMRDYTQAKLDLIANTNYETAKESEYKKKSIGELSTLKDRAHASGKPELEKYIEAHIAMKNAEKLGIKQTYTVEDRLSIKTWGNSGRTHHRWKVQAGSLKGSVKTPSREDLSSPKKFLKWLAGLDASTKETLLNRAQLTEEDIAKGKVQSMKTAELDDLYENVLEISKDVVKAEGKFKAVKAGYKYKNGIFNFDSNVSVGAAKASGKIGAAFKAGKLWEAGAKLQFDASGAAAQGRIKIGLNGKNLGVNAKVSGKVLSGSATAYAGAGRFTYKDEKGNDQDVAGVAAMVSAQASLAEAEGGLSFTICGIKIGASATVQAGGFGGTIGGYANTKSIGATFGALAGLGFKLSVNIDWGGIGTWWKERKERQRIKAEQRAEMRARADARKLAKAAIKGGVKKDDTKKKGPAKEDHKIKKAPTMKEKDAPEDDHKVVRTTSVNDLKKKLGENKKEDEHNVQRSLTNRLSSTTKKRGGKVDDNRPSLG